MSDADQADARHITRRTLSPNSRTHPRMIVSAEREVSAIDMRRAGHSFQEIAGALGYADRSAARKAVMRGLQRGVDEPLEEATALHLERLDEIYKSLYPERHKPVVAIALLKVLDQRARVTGTYAQKEHQHWAAPNTQDRARETVERVEEFQRLLGEVADREIQRRLAERRLAPAVP